MLKRNRKPPCRKIVLRLPDLDQAKSAVLNSLSSPSSRRNYKFAMEQFITWYCSEPRLTLNRAVVLRFRLYLESLGLAAGTVNQRLAAVKRLGCGLRRAELSSLEIEDMQIRQGHWAIVDLVGKSSHVRTVPMPNWVKEAVDRWMIAAKVTAGRIFRAISRHGTSWGKGISENVVWYVVRRCAERMQLDHLAPHDLRRTCAKLCHVNGGEIEQIQFLLGHASVLTTERYLGCKQDLEKPVNDRFGCLFADRTVELR
jgi:integrase